MARKKKKNKKLSFSIRNAAILYCGLVIILLLYRVSSEQKVNSASLAVENVSGINYYANTKIVYFTPTPSPTLTPTPTPTTVPLKFSGNTVQNQGGGYCLNVPILMYHHIQPQSVAAELGQVSLNVDNGVFDQQMAYLASQGYSAISAEQLVNALRTRSGVPAKSIVLTFDDGYKDIATYAFPILQKYNLVGNLMIPTGLMENNGYLSWGDLRGMVGSGLAFAYPHTCHMSPWQAFQLRKPKRKYQLLKRNLSRI